MANNQSGARLIGSNAPEVTMRGVYTIETTPQKAYAFCNVRPTARDAIPSAPARAASWAKAITVPSPGGCRPNGIVASTTMNDCTATMSITRNTRPASSAKRLTGEQHVRASAGQRRLPQTAAAEGAGVVEQHG